MQLFTFGAFQRLTCWHLLIPLNSSIITPWNLHYFWGPWVECLQPSLDISGKLCVSSSCVSSSDSVQVSGRTCQRSTQMFDSGCTMLDGGSLAPHSSQNVGRHSLAVPDHKNLIVDVSVGQALQGSTISAFNPLAAAQCVFTQTGVLFLSLSGSSGATLKHLHQRSTSSVGRNG